MEQAKKESKVMYCMQLNEGQIVPHRKEVRDIAARNSEKSIENLSSCYLPDPQEGEAMMFVSSSRRW